MLAPLQSLRPLSRPLFVAAAGGGIALVSSVASGASSNGTTSSAIDTSGASFLVMVVCSYAGVGEPSIFDSRGNTWAALTAYAVSLIRIRIYYSAGASVGTGHTFTATGGTSYATIGVAAFSGVSAASPYDAVNGAFSASSPIHAGSITPAVANELMIAGLNFNQPGASVSIDSGFSIAAQKEAISGGNFGCAIAWKITSAAENPAWTVSSVESSGLAATLAAFKP